VRCHGYDDCVALSDGPARLVLGHHCGGRVLEFSFGGVQAVHFDPAQDGRMPGPDGVADFDPTGGRCDIGPETITPAHPALWVGPWTVASAEAGETPAPQGRDAGGTPAPQAGGTPAPQGGRPAVKIPTASARIASVTDPVTGARLEREFRMYPAGADAVRVDFTQTVHNLSTEPRAFCHWGRTFAPGGGIVAIPLDGRSRFPEGYVHYGPDHEIHYRPRLLREGSVRRRDGFVEITGAPRWPKLGFDSMAGWFAYLMPGDVAFVKRYPTFPDRVYNEVAGLTISIYYPRELCELEPIGPREDLAPGGSAMFAEEWWLVRFPFPKPGRAADLAGLRRIVEALPKE
jgi:hypothetical protein